MSTFDYEWRRSSFCASGACVLVAGEFGGVVVSDSKLGDASSFRGFTSGGWARVLEDIRNGFLPDGVTRPTYGTVAWGVLRFTNDEWDAFVAGVHNGEFDYDKLSSGEAGSGFRGVARSGQAATGAGAIAVPPVPVAAPEAVTETIRADQLTPGRTVLIPMTESLETVTQVRGSSGSYVMVHTSGTGPDSAYQWPAGDEISAVVAVPPAPVAANPTIGEARYILDKDAILELVHRYGNARAYALLANLTPDQLAKQQAEQDDLLDAIRAALTPVPDVEPEPAWGSGPLVEHVTETPADPRPPEPSYPAGICRCGADGHGPGDNLCVCRSAS